MAAGTVRDLIDGLAEARAEAPFLISPEARRELSFGAVRRRAEALARRLLGLGLAKGDKVAFLLDNGLFGAELYLGALYGGFVPVPLNVAAGRSGLEYVLDHSDTRVVFVSGEYLEPLQDALGSVERPVGVTAAHPDDGPDWGQAEPPAAALPPLHPDDDASLGYTSGSTGRPKGVLLAHRNLVAGCHTRVSRHGLSPRDRALCVLPLYHGNALLLSLMSTLASGGSVVIPRRFSAATFWDLVAEYRCTWFALVPTIISHLLRWTDPYAEGKAAGLEQVRFARSSSAPLPATLHRAFETKFKLVLIEAMGSTEAAGASFSNPLPPGQRKSGSVGLATGFEATIVDHAGRPLPAGQVGEIILRGPSVMKGYYKDPRATARAIDPDGWLHTGDLGYRDPDGYFFVVGRAKDLIIKGGENIAPREIDEALGRHPAVREAAVVGVPDPHLGEDVVAYVVVRPGQACTERELIGFCEAELGGFKTPTRVYFVEALPKGTNGKVQRPTLVEAATKAAAPARPAGDQPASRSERGPAAPRTPTEEVLAGIWVQVLGRDQVGAGDNFFELGGHSLLASRVLARVRDALGVGLSLRSLFEAPTVAGLARAIERARRGPAELRPPLVPTAPARHRPASLAQERLWFLHQLDPDSPAYNNTSAVRLSGLRDPAALERSLNEIIRRHASLRTTFEAVEGRPVQVITPSLTLDLPLVDCPCPCPCPCPRPGPEQAAELARLARELGQQPFDLARGPLVRAALFALGEAEHLLLLSIHHIVSDDWSFGVLLRELGALYDAYSRGRPSPLEELPIQYADFAAWQREWLRGEVLEQHLTYWRARLAGAPPLLELPTDRPRPAVRSFNGARHPLVLSGDVTDALQALSRCHGVTLYMTLLAAFQTLLGRYTGQDDIVVGSGSAGRDRLELEGSIGFFINTLVLRTDLSGDPTFRELLERVRETCLGAYAHQDLPFEKLVEALQPERDRGRTPLVQVVFVMSATPRETAEPSSLAMLPRIADNGTAKFDLRLMLGEGPAGLSGDLEYSTDLFEAATISRFVGHFRALLAGIVADPGRRLSELPLLTDAERRQVLVEWNATGKDYPREARVHDLFEQQTDRTPDAVALVCGEQRLTYQQLNRRANRLAHHLRRLGVGPEVPVGLCLERSPELIVGLLGILKAGGAYLPLDPAYPTERLAFMLEDAAVPVLLTRTRLVPLLPATRARVVCLDAAGGPPGPERAENPVGGATAEGLAYVIYTSGSSGQPKGVMVEHRSVVNLVLAGARMLGADARGTWSCCHSIAFDFSVWEIFVPLTAGGRVVIVPTEVGRSPRDFVRLLRDQGVTVLCQTPSGFRLLVADPAAWREGPTSLGFVIFGGEALEATDIPAWFRTDVGARTWNMYGITEVTVHATLCKLEAIRPGDGRPPIGRPIANTRVYLLDRHGNFVPVGAPGELHVGGDGLARGYLNRPELTAERFIADPFSDQPGARLYRTGDLARYRPDGNLEFIGRLDRQVKVRGFRIEPGEIEAALGRHPGVRGAVVQAREDEPGDQRLVAYVVPRGDPAPTAGDLRGFLRERLPEYLVPAAFVPLPALPLGPGGKLDRRALPLPEHAPAGAERPFVAPRTSLERVLTKIWASVLGLQRVGATDNFFDLGGHSLLATRVISRVREACRLELPLRCLFESPTPADLATAIVQRRAKQARPEELTRLLGRVEAGSAEPVTSRPPDEDGRVAWRPA